MIFWHRLGTPFPPILMPTWLQLSPQLGPKIAPKALQEPSKIHPKSHLIFDKFFDRFLIDFWLIFDPKIDQKSTQNRPSTHHLFKSAFYFVFWSIFSHFSFKRSTTRTLKIEKKTLQFFNILASSTFYKLCYIDIHFSSQFSSILDPKIIKNWFKNRSKSMLIFWLIFC